MAGVRRPLITHLEISVPSSLQYGLFFDSWFMKVRHVYNLNFFRRFPWARGMNAVLAAKCAVAPGLPCERSEHRHLRDTGPHSGGSAVAKHSLLTRSLAIKCGLWAKMALSWGQSSSFKAPHLDRPLWEKPHLEFQLSLNLITHLDSH